jgi:transcriptional regulator with XRE-family HTH domain
MRRLRTDAGLTLDDIVAETKISRAILENLETGDFRFLPQKVFCRNFVAQYARVVGVDPDQLVGDFEDAWARFELASGSFPDLVVEEQPLVGTVRWRFWGPVAAAAAILVAASVFIVRTSLRDENPLAMTTRSQGAAGGGVAATPLVRQRPPTPSPVVAPTANDAEPELVTITVRVRPDGECWVHFRDHDGAAGGKLLAGGSKEQIELVGPVKLTIGDAAAATLEVDGKIYENLGRPGQVVHAEVSNEGLVVLGPRSWDE